MTWWVWVVAGWAAASLAVALLLGQASAEVSRRERHASTADELPLPAPPVSVPMLVRGVRRRVAGSRPGAGSPPPRPVSRRVPVTGARRPVASGQRPEPREVAGRGTARPPRSPGRSRAAQGSRAVPSPTSVSAPVVVLAGSRVRTPPPPVRPRLRPRVQRALLLSCVPVLALAPLLASSTSSLGKNSAIAAELAAHPDQEHQLIAALDRGRVLAGLSTPVTAPEEAAPPPAPAPGDDGSDGGGDADTRTPTPSGSPGTSTPATGTDRTAAPQPPRTAEVPPRTDGVPDVAAPTQGAVPTTPPAEPEPTPTGTGSPTPTPTPTPSEPTPSPTDPVPAEPTPVEPTPTDPEPTPSPTGPAPTSPTPVDPQPSAPAPTADGAAPEDDAAEG